MCKLNEEIIALLYVFLDIVKLALVDERTRASAALCVIVYLYIAVVKESL